MIKWHTTTPQHPVMPYNTGVSKGEEPVMFSVYYSDDEHDHFFTESPSLFEATCEFFQFINSDWNEGEWVTIRDDNDNIIKANY